MPRKSKIEQLGIGDKVVGYSVSGMEAPEIIRRIALEHAGVKLTPNNISTYLHKRSLDIREKKAVSINNEILFTLDSFKKQLHDTIEDIRLYMEKWEDNPKAGASGLKLRLDALDKVGKMIGAFQPENQVNVQVNVAAKSVEDQTKEFEEYFQALEAKKSS